MLSCWSGITSLLRLNSTPRLRKLQRVRSQKSSPIACGLLILPVAEAVESTPGKPKPADIVAAANSLNSTFPKVPNTNLCNWIADDVAAAAGTAMPLPDAQLDPTNNVPGGFWRIFYTGVGPNPVQNWFTK